MLAHQYLQIANVEKPIIVNEDAKQHKLIFNVRIAFFSPYIRLLLFKNRRFCFDSIVVRLYSYAIEIHNME